MNAPLRRHSASPCGREGSALLITVAVILLLLLLCCAVFSVGETARRRVALQNACDAAAYSAAVVQADGLSRMAAINREMSRAYRELVKAQMDLLLYRWLRLVRDRFEEDMECVKRTGPEKMFSHKAGYWHWNFNPIIKAATEVGRFGIYLWPLGWAHWGFDCDTKTHDRKEEGPSHYIGMGPDKIHWIRIGYRDNEGTDNNYLLYRDHDLFPILDPKTGETSKEGLLSLFEKTYGGPGVANLVEEVRNRKQSIALFNALLEATNLQMSQSIRETVRRTLYENLPRRRDGSLDTDFLKDYVWFSFGGTSEMPFEYDTNRTDDESATATEAMTRRYFSGLRNTEADEIVFLDMADGVPEFALGSLKLPDYFQDTDTVAENDDLRKLAGGLDQWFIRCDPAECTTSTTIALDRAAPGYGIVRCYKNANYDEGRAVGSFIQQGVGIGADVHRGNYVFEGLIEQAIKAFNTGLNHKISLTDGFNLGPRGSRLSMKRRKYRQRQRVLSRIKAAESGFINPFQTIVDGMMKSFRRIVEQFVSLDIAPSANNFRNAFVDQCASVPENYGLVAEYKWSSAYWFCSWVSLNGYKHCNHLGIPFGAVFGGASDNGYGQGLFKWFSPQWRMLSKRHGICRTNYKSTFIGLDGDPPDNCPRHGGANGKGAFNFLDGYCRIYGDDIEIFDNDLYCGEVARPWIVNTNFFDGQGTIFVGIARRQRNLFENLIESTESPGLYAAFEPKAPRGGLPHLVTLAAGRAGPARRRGNGRAEGTDSANGVTADGRNFPVPPSYELAFDAVTDTSDPNTLRASLPDLDGDSEYRRRRRELEDDHIGCVCEDPLLEKRLRREWNLSQCDWGAMLLPVREGLSAAARTDSADDPDAVPEWSFDESDSAAGVRGFVSLLFATRWNRFDEADGGAATTSSGVFGGASDEEMNDLFQKRLVH